MATIRKRRNKNWQAVVRFKGLKSQSKTFERKTDAVVWAKQIEAEMHRGSFVDTSESESVTIHDLIERYLGPLDMSNRTNRIAKSCCDMLAKELGKYSCARLSPSHIADYRDKRLKEVSPTTVNHGLSMLYKLLKLAQDEWGIPFPQGIPKVKKPKRPRGRNRRLEGDEEGLLLDELSDNQVMISVFIVAVETAMRRSEMATAQWQEIDWQRQILFLPKTKNGDTRTVPLSDRAIEALKATPNTGELIFGITANSMSQAFKRACERAGIEGLRFHDLRHEATSRLFEKGLNTMEVATITGHKTLSMLNRYTHLRAEDLVHRL